MKNNYFYLCFLFLTGILFAQPGTLDVSFNTVDNGTYENGPNSTVWTITIQPDDKIIIGGDFTNYNDIPRSRIARLNTDGSLDTTFDPGSGANGTISSATIQPDGKIIIGGDFTNYNDIPRSRIARLNTDGS
ncbi:MAG: delta-60 repeat domain-containing protein, partial [Flavobacterium sp.]